MSKDYKKQNKKKFFHQSTNFIFTHKYIIWTFIFNILRTLKLLLWLES